MHQNSALHAFVQSAAAQSGAEPLRDSTSLEDVLGNLRVQVGEARHIEMALRERVAKLRGAPPLSGSATSTAPAAVPNGLLEELRAATSALNAAHEESLALLAHLATDI